VVFDRIASYFSRAGITARVNQCATSSISLVGLVAAGAGIGLVVESLACIARPDIRFVPLSDEPPSLGYAMCHRSDLPGELQSAFLHAFNAPKAGAGARPVLP
jgi:DNA-binding transcriptional LysR family regulator